METLDTITAQPVPNAARLEFLPKHLPTQYATAEGLIFGIMNTASDLYSGGLWEFMELTNGGFYMFPTARDTWPMKWDDNYFEGDLTNDAAGIAVCLMALGWLAFEKPDSPAGEKFHQLRDYALDHPEAGLIFGFID